LTHIPVFHIPVLQLIILILHQAIRKPMQTRSLKFTALKKTQSQACFSTPQLSQNNQERAGHLPKFDR
jgi:hypothetical protein